MSSLFDFDGGGGFLFGASPRKHDAQRRRERRPSAPPADILETPGAYTFLLDVPGLSKSDLQVTLEDDSTLVVASGGKRKREEEEGDGDGGGEEGCRYLRMERLAPGRFSRRFRLPEDADAGAVSARCESGVLTVVVEKRAPPDSRARKVEVAVA